MYLVVFKLDELVVTKAAWILLPFLLLSHMQLDSLSIQQDPKLNHYYTHYEGATGKTR